MSTRDGYVKKMHELLDRLNPEIDALADKAERARARRARGGP